MKYAEKKYLQSRSEDWEAFNNILLFLTFSIS